MSDYNKLTGDPFLDRLYRGNVERNPAYNPKTKKGRSVSPTMIVTDPGDMHGGAASAIAESSNAIDYTSSDFNIGLDRIERDKEYGIAPSPYNTDEELNLARSQNQSTMNKFGNMLMQAGVGEVILGGLEGFGNIYDGIANLITGNNYDRSAWTQYFEEAREKLRNDYEITQRDPDASWDLGDWGWWFNGAVTIATTASLLIPAAGTMRAISYIGKLSRLNKGLSYANKYISKGIAKAGSKLSKADNKFGALRTIAGKSGRIEKTIESAANIGSMAFLQRTAENYMESKEVFDDVHENSLETLNGMSDEEFEKFLFYNPEFVKDGQVMSKEDIAKEIARQSANKTFYNDYWMLAMDVVQLKALGSLWGGKIKRRPNARQRIVADNAKKTFAGVEADKLIKDNVWNRLKYATKDAITHPLSNVSALQLNEGFEEMFQGIQTEKGFETASKYFNPYFTPRSISSYLEDNKIWEQGFWGVFGGIAFTGIHRGINRGGHTIQGMYNKKHMTSEQYERWKRSDTKIATEQLKSINSRTTEFIENMEKISNGVNPFSFVKDEHTGKIILKDGETIEERIDENQQDALKQYALDKFVQDITLDSIDAGTFDLLKDVLTSSEFDQYLTKNGANVTASDKTLSQQVANRMEQISGIYYTSLNDVYRLADTTNPFVSIAAARNITRNQLKLEDLISQGNAAEAEITSLNTNGTDYSTYVERMVYDSAQQQLKKLDLDKRLLKTRLDNEEISKSAYNQMINNIARSENTIMNYVSNNTAFGALDATKDLLKEMSKNNTSLIEHFNNFVTDFKNSLLDNFEVNIPTETIRERIDQKIQIEKEINITKSFIPTTFEEMQDLYNEFSRGMDQVYRNRIDEALDKLKDYLLNVENFEEGVANAMNASTGNKQLDEMLDLLRYGYQMPEDANPNKKDNRESDIGQQRLIDFNIDFIITSVKEEREKINEIQEEAEKNNVVIPSNEDVESNNDLPFPTPKTEDDTEDVESNNDKSPSTGKETKENTKDSNRSEPEGVITNNDEEAILEDDGVIKNDTSEKNIADETSEDIEKVNREYGSERGRAAIDAGTYIAQIGYKEPVRLEEMIVDNNKFNDFIKEIYDFLISKGYNPKVASIVSKTQLRSSIESLGALKNGGVFTKLANALAMRINEKSAKKYSITELLGGAAVDEIVDEFLQEYSRLIGGTKFGSDKYIINVESLFDFLLNDYFDENSKIKLDRFTVAKIYDNLSQYIAKNNGLKYIFTGFSQNRKILSSDKFFEILDQNKAQSIASSTKMHLHSVELENRDKNYDEALIKVHNGEYQTIIEEEFTTVQIITGYRENGTPIYKPVPKVSNLSVYAVGRKGNKDVKIKLGILRAVKANQDLSSFSPNSYSSGFSNTVTIINGQPKLDCDFLFTALIEHSNDNKADQLYNDLLQYIISVRDAYNKYESSRKSDQDRKELTKTLKELMSEDNARRILNNEYVKKLIETGKYKFANKDGDIIKQAKEISHKISNILFYGQTFDESDPNSRSLDRLAIDKDTMKKRYEDWQNKVYQNYLHTYELQKNIKTNNKVSVHLNVGYNTTINTTADKNKYSNINELPIDVDEMPLVMVDEGGHWIDEEGNDLGYTATYREYDMGYVVHNQGTPLVATFAYNEVPNLAGSKLAKAIEAELLDIITTQFSNTNSDTHEETFNNLKARLIDLFKSNGLFKFGNYVVTYDSNNAWVSISKKINGQSIPIITIYNKNKDNVTNSNAISVLDESNNKFINITSFENNKNYTSEEIKKFIYDTTSKILSDIRLNKSKAGMTGVYADGSTPVIFTKTKDEFIVRLGGKEIKYKNYGDFIINNEGFKTNVVAINGSMVTNTMNENSISIDTNIQETPEIELEHNTNVSDLLFTDKKPKTKTVSTRDLLTAAGVEENEIDILLGVNTNLPILTNRIIPDSLDDGQTNAFYGTSEGNSKKGIHITPKGAMSMNSNPLNTKRLLIHENIHRLFATKYNSSERQRIVNELKEVYDYLIKQLEADVKSHNISQQMFDSIMNVLNKATSYNSEETNMEEFMVECLTQPVILDYINNTQYIADADLNTIDNRKKSILQKIIDILLDLMGIKENKIKNNSILARQYIILSRTSKNTKSIKENTTKETKANSDNAKSPVEGEQTDKTKSDKVLNDTKKKIENIANKYKERITRSDNFQEDHTYYLDGEPVEYSVTQRIHGKQDLGQIGVAASALGNTADDAARTYFDNNGTIPDNHNIPNVENDEDLGLGVAPDNSRSKLKQDIKKIEDYLDNRFGKGKYGVVTEEFPIAGIINTNGKNSSIAGTMDMIVYTDTGDIYIFDFKTRRLGDDTGNITEDALKAYKQQLNIYRQIILANNPELVGKVHLGGLIKFNVNYPVPSNNIVYRASKNNQLQISEDGGKTFVNIQDSNVDYMAPTFPQTIKDGNEVVNVEVEDFVDEIKALPEVEENDINSGKLNTGIESEFSDDDFNLEDYITDFGDERDDLDAYNDIKKSVTDIIEDKHNTPIEIYSESVINGAENSVYGIKVVNDIQTFVDNFPAQYRANIQQLLADDKINYTCS